MEVLVAHARCEIAVRRGANRTLVAVATMILAVRKHGVLEPIGVSSRAASAATAVRSATPATRRPTSAPGPRRSGRHSRWSDGGATRAGRDHRRTGAGEAGDAVDTRGLKGLGQGHRRQHGGEPPGEHRLARPRGAEQEQIMVRTPASRLALPLPLRMPITGTSS
jgi:hypothetical protein